MLFLKRHFNLKGLLRLLDNNPFVLSVQSSNRAEIYFTSHHVCMIHLSVATAEGEQENTEFGYSLFQKSLKYVLTQELTSNIKKKL